MAWEVDIRLGASVGKLVKRGGGQTAGLLALDLEQMQEQERRGGEETRRRSVPSDRRRV